MPLSVGDKLGHYEVVSLLGQGGMGEVYKARDTTLKREVALKVLPASFLRDSERMARFQREAEVLASLDHPNVGPIYGIVDSEDSRGLVLALIEGPTLADQIALGPLPLDDALAISKQIIEALEYAHDRGVVHRDLKPANIKITPEGVVKVLDFGLAKVLEDEPPKSSLGNSPTLTLGHTRAGVILGTAAYMSPEQAIGRPVDRRSDIFSFGAVLFEMLTGKRAFSGTTTPDVLEAVVKNDPDWSLLPSSTPAYVRRLLERTLAKDRKQRVQAIGEARIALSDPMEDPPAQTPPVLRYRSWLPWCIAAFLLLALMPANLLHFREQPPPERILRLSVPFPENISNAASFAISPDGRRLAIVRRVDGGPAIWLRSFDSPAFQRLSGTDGVRGIFWSPDGRNIGFFSDGKLKTVPANGGPPQVLCDAGTYVEGTWSSQDVILFHSDVGWLERASAKGGCTPLTRTEGAIHHRSPEFLPDGQHFLYTVTGGGQSQNGVYLATLDAPNGRRLMADESPVRFAPRSARSNFDHILFLRDANLMAQAFDTSSFQLIGDAFRVGAEATTNLNNGLAASAVSSGVLIYLSATRGESQITWLDRGGKELAKVGPRGDVGAVALSPDEKTVALMRTDSLSLFDLVRNFESKFTPGYGPIWSPDGSRIAFRSGRDLYLKDTRGGTNEQLVLTNGNLKTPTDWSRDGRYLLYTEIDPKTHEDIWYLANPAGQPGEVKPMPFLQSESREGRAQFSPDGRWVAYEGQESGRREVYVRPFPTGPGQWKISSKGGGMPHWRRDGKELYYMTSLTAGAGLMAVPVLGSGQAFETGVPKLLFEFPLSGQYGETFVYAPSADGLRFLVNESASDVKPTLNVITNWEKVAAASQKETAPEP